MRMRKPIQLLIVMILVSFSIQLILSVQSVEFMIRRFLADDFFYYLGVSESISKGLGPVFSAGDMTNGFHPLFVIIQVPLFWLTNSNILPINLSLIILSIFFSATAYFLFKIVSMKFGEEAGLFASFFWLFNPILIFTALMGTEVAIYVFFISAVFYYYLKYRDSLKIKNALIIGILLGLTILSRTEGVILLVTLLIDQFIHKKCWKKPKKIKPFLKFSFFLTTPSVIITLPWFLWNYLTFGTIIQSSAKIKYLMGHKLFFDATNISFSETIKHIFLNYTMPFQRFYHMIFIRFSHGIGLTISLILGLLIIFFTGLFLFDTKKSGLKLLKKRIKNTSELWFTLLFAFLVFSFYAVYLWIFRNWYYLSLGLVGTIWISVLYKYFSSMKRILCFIIPILFLIIFVFLGFFMIKTGFYQFQDEMYTLGEIEIPKLQGTVGAFNAGIYGYLNPNVINLDGLINNKAAEYILNGNIAGYIKEKNVTYLIDNIDTIKRFARNEKNPEAFWNSLKLYKIIPTNLTYRGDWYIYRVV